MLTIPQSQDWKESSRRVLNQHTSTIESIRWDLSEARGGLQATNFEMGQKFAEVRDAFAAVGSSMEEKKNQLLESATLIADLSTRVDKLVSEDAAKDTRIQTLEDQVLYLEGRVEEQHCSLMEFDSTLIKYNFRQDDLEKRLDQR